MECGERIRDVTARDKPECQARKLMKKIPLPDDDDDDDAAFRNLVRRALESDRRFFRSADADIADRLL